MKEVMMPYEMVLYEKRGRIAYVTLNRPEKLNAMNDQLIQELDEALDEFDLDDEVFVAILSGRGRAFCAGRDVQAFRQAISQQTEGGKQQPGGPPRRSEVRNWKPVIGAVHGYVYGRGLSIAMACDIIVASEDTQFALPEIKRSIAAGAIWARLAQWIPPKVAAEMALTGDPISAQAAYRLGLVNQLVSRDQLMAEAERMAERVLAVPPLAVRATVLAIRLASEQATKERAAQSPPVFSLTETEDHREAVNAFLEKRQPVFRGR